MHIISLDDLTTLGSTIYSHLFKLLKINFFWDGRKGMNVHNEMQCRPSRFQVDGFGGH